MKSLVSTLILILAITAGFSQKADTTKQKADSVYAYPKVVKVLLSQEDAAFLEAVLSDQDVSHERFKLLRIEVINQMRQQLVKIPKP